MVTFLRRTSERYSKLGKGRKKKQIWRRPTGRDNKMREKRRGYPAVVSVGYKTDKNESGLIEGKKPVIVNNIKELAKIQKNEIVILGSIGNKKKIEIINKAKEMKVEIKNINEKKFLNKVAKKKEVKKAIVKEEVKTKSDKKPKEIENELKK